MGSGGGSGGSSAPDPYKTAEAQQQQNRQSAQDTAVLNNYNAITPWGTSTWTQNGVLGGQNVNMNPAPFPTTAQQSNTPPMAYNPGENPVPMQDLGDSWFDPVAGVSIPKTNNVSSGAVGGGGQVSGGNGQWTNTITPNAQMQAQIEAAMGNMKPFTAPTAGQYSDPAYLRGQLGPIQQGIDRSRYGGDTSQITNVIPDAGTIPTANDAYMQKVSDSLYGSQKRYLDPQYDLMQAQLDNRLSNQGLTPGSAAYNNAQGLLGTQRNQAYSTARDSAITGGVGAGQTLFGMDLAGQGQRFGQNQARSQFQNAAQQQGYGQLLGTGQFANAAQQQGAAQILGLSDVADKNYKNQLAAEAAARKAENDRLALLYNMTTNKNTGSLGGLLG